VYRVSFTLPYLTKMTNRSHGQKWWVVKQDRDKVKNDVNTFLRGKDRMPSAPLDTAQITIVRCSSTMCDYDGMVSGGKPIIDAFIESGVLVDDKLTNIGVTRYLWKKVKRGEGRVEVHLEETDDIDIPIVQE